MNADEVERQRRVESAAVAFYDHSSVRDRAAAAVAEAEAAMGGQVAAILDDGETVERAATLLDLSAADVRRLAKLARDTAPATAAPEAVGHDGDAGQVSA